MTKAPWDTSFHRAMNKRKNLEVTLPPHRGRVIGVGVGRKRSHYYPESKEERHDRKAVSMQDTIDMAVTKAITANLPTMYESFGSWIEGGKKDLGPFPAYQTT